MSATPPAGMTFAVLGYVPDAVAKTLVSQPYGEKPIKVRIERGNDQQVVQIKPDQIAGILHGASLAGETAVQVFLKDQASVDTIARSVNDLYLRRIRDGSLWQFTPPIVCVFAPPGPLGNLASTIARTAQ